MEPLAHEVRLVRHGPHRVDQQARAFIALSNDDRVLQVLARNPKCHPDSQDDPVPDEVRFLCQVLPPEGLIFLRAVRDVDGPWVVLLGAALLGALGATLNAMRTRSRFDVQKALHGFGKPMNQLLRKLRNSCFSLLAFIHTSQTRLIGKLSLHSNSCLYLS